MLVYRPNAVIIGRNSLEIVGIRTDFAGRAFTLIVITAFLAIIPMLFFGNVWGHDFDFHLTKWMDAAQQFRQGVIYPRWLSGANAGFGEPAFIFYPPLSWAIGGALGLILPWKLVPGVYVWLVLVLAGTAMWKCASEWLDPPDAVIASLIYAVNPYMMVMVYKRCSYGDLLASAFLPLLVWAAIGMGRDAKKRILPLAIVFAAIWLADLPEGMIASYSLALLLLTSSFLHRSIKPVLHGTATILTTFACLAFFLFPAAWEQRWVNIGMVLRPDWVPDTNFLFSHISNPGMLLFNRGVSFLALFLVVVIAGAALFARRLRRDAFDIWFLLVVFGGVSAFLLFRQSSILWRIMPELRYVEYPWRWLSALCVAGAVLISSAIAQASKRWTFGVAAALAIGIMSAGIVYTVRWDSQHREMETLAVATRSGAGYASQDDLDWCGPRGSQPSKLPERAPLVAANDPEDGKEISGKLVQIQVKQWLSDRKAFSVNSTRPVLLKIKILAYPAWQASLNGKVVPFGTEKETGQMLLAAPAGLNHAEIQFVQTWDRTAGACVSLITVLTLILLMVVARWRGSPSAVNKSDPIKVLP